MVHRIVGSHHLAAAISYPLSHIAIVFAIDIFSAKVYIVLLGDWIDVVYLQRMLLGVGIVVESLVDKAIWHIHHIGVI